MRSSQVSRAIGDAVAAVPAGAWAVGVSGGADSVALLLALAQRADLRLHVVHLDHQTRGEESTADAEFVRALADRLNLPCTLATRSQIEPLAGKLPKNPSALYRRLRLALFARAISEHGLAGVLLAHHADDQAQTILQRLLRGASAAGLAGMMPSATIAGIAVIRPLLAIPSQSLREFLRERDQPWREDSSNRSMKYLRNRVRPLIAARPALRDALLDLGAACRELRSWELRNLPGLESTLPVRTVQDLPALLARAMLRGWLAKIGVPRGEIDSACIERVLQMAADAASPPRIQLPGGITIARRRGVLERVRPSAH
jgi:tRNA(Ile)-lysidine synthetase-like protein